MRARTAWWWSSLAVLLLSAGPLRAQPHFSYSQAPLARVIADVEARTPYRFLYRDALLDGSTVTCEADLGALPEALAAALRPQGLGLDVDRVHGQLMLYALREATTTVSGYVLDARTGARLPYATVSWREAGALRGVVADDAGRFALILPDDAPPRDLTASFVGYAPAAVRVALPLEGRIAFRLRPQDVWMAEPVVTGTLLQADLDTALARVLTARAAAGLAEPSTFRALQALPSVGIGPAFAAGPHVRGARADGFEVLLDGVPIYAPTHFFGLFDAFNPDVLQTVAFYLDMAPAAYFAPPGGTLAYSTRTGSQRTPRASAGLTNTSARGAIEGPLAGGRGSFLVAGRHSTLGLFGWMGNDALVRMGLDVSRPTAPLPDTTATDVEAATVRPGGAEASFHDLHGKVLFETAGGSRWTVSGYAGADATEQDATRYRPVSSLNDTPRLRPEPVETRNAWASRSASVQHQAAWGRLAVSTVAAWSRYEARFAKDDFPFQRDPTRPVSLLRGRVDTLGYANAFREGRLVQQVAWPLSARQALSLGYSLHHYRARYEEQSGRRPRFTEDVSSTQADVFGELLHQHAPATVRVGLRAHAFARGAFARLSPRVRLEVAAHERLTLAAGYSRNHQFLHRLYLENFPSAAVWVLSRPDAPPVEAESFSGSVRWQALPAMTLQAEGYLRTLANLRQHETNATARAISREAVLTQPWLTDLDARARGLELLAALQAGRLAWTNAYTLSRTDLEHPDLHDGAPFRADYDRTHQFRSSVQVALTRKLSVQALWLYGSGTPNRLAAEFDSEPATLAAYHRLDAALRFATGLRGETRLHASLALYNVYDRRNPWYRETVSVVRGAGLRRRFGYYNVDVYDLGFTPSFEMSVQW